MNNIKHIVCGIVGVSTSFLMVGLVYEKTKAIPIIYLEKYSDRPYKANI
jgi:hypothetical protein